MDLIASDKKNFDFKMGDQTGLVNGGRADSQHNQNQQESLQQFYQQQMAQNQVMSQRDAYQIQNMNTSDRRENIDQHLNQQIQKLSLEEPRSEYVCYHCNMDPPRQSTFFKKANKYFQVKVGDAHLMNCNICGAFLPKSQHETIRSRVRHSELFKLYQSDMLRTMYSQCQLKSQKPDLNVKIGTSYNDVRNLIIEWLCEVSETLHLSQRSMYHAINILDRFLSHQAKLYKKEMDQSAVMLQALSCLFISAKNYEMDPTVPSSRKFLKQLPGYKPTQRENVIDNQLYGMQGGYNDNIKFDSKKNELCEQEQYILNLIDFELDSYPLFYDIIEILMAQGVMFKNDQIMSHGQLKPITADKKTINLLEKYVDFFTLLAAQDAKLVNTNQYLVSCSVISCSRKHCNFSPVWSIELEQLTGLQHAHFINIEKRIISKFEQQYNQTQTRSVSRTDDRPSNIDQTPSQATAAHTKSTPATTEVRPVTVVTPNVQQKTSPQDAPPTTQVPQTKSDFGNLEDTDLKYRQQIQQSRPSNHTTEPTNYSSGTRVPYNTSAQQEHQAPSTRREDSKPPELKQVISVQNENQQKLQKSHVFQKLVQNNKSKYENKIKQEKDELQKSGKTNSSLQVGKPTAEDYENRQAQLRMKYGSLKQKQNYYSSRLGTGAGHPPSASTQSRQQQIIQNSNKAQHNTSTKNIPSSRNGRTASTVSQSSAQLNRQKSSVSVTSAPGGGHHHQASAGQFSSRLMSGTASSNIRKQAVQQNNQLSNKRGSHVYNRQMSNLRQQINGIGGSSALNSGRAPSVTSTGSNSRLGGISKSVVQSSSALQNSAAKSLVRNAMKHQKRGERVAGSGHGYSGSTVGHNYNSNISHDRSKQQSSQNSRAAQNNRYRVASGAAFLRAGQGSVTGGYNAVRYQGEGSSSNIDIRNQRNNSNLSRGGHIGNSLSKQPQTTKSQQSIFNQRQSQMKNSHTKLVHARDGSVASNNSSSSMPHGLGFRNHNAGFQQVKTTHPQNITNLKPQQKQQMNTIQNEGLQRHNELMQNYNDFQNKINNMKKRAQVMNVGIAGDNQMNNN